MASRHGATIALALLLGWSPCASAQKLPDTLTGTQRLTRLAVIGLPDVITDRILEHLTVGKRFLPVERTALAAALSEQRFGKPPRKTSLDRTLEKAIRDMDKVEGATIAITGALSMHNDFLKECADLGTAVGAQYLILGNIEKLTQSTHVTAVPYARGRTVQREVNDARLRLRIIDVKTATVVGARSIRVVVTNNAFDGKVSDKDSYSFLDDVGRTAASAVLDLTFPARLVQLNPLLISRGANEGVRAGDRYEIQREGRDVRDDTGAVIGRARAPVGRVEVIQVQDNIAVVKPLDGRDFQLRDLALASPASGTDAKPEDTRAPPPLVRGPPDSQLPRIAVGLIRPGSTAAEEKESLTTFTDAINSRLAQSKRFRVIDRQEVEQLLNEQLAGALEQGRGLKSALGTLKGADYLLFGRVSVFAIETQTTKLPHSTRTFEQKVGHVEGNVRVVEVASGEIKESRKVTITRNLDGTSGKTASLAGLADVFAAEVTRVLLEAIYPIKVVAVGQDSTVYVNRGTDGGLRKGERLRAYRPGKAIVDADSGASLGAEEIRVGDVVIQEIEGARSKATMAPGARVLVGDLLKREGDSTPAAVKVQPERTGAPLPSSGTKRPVKAAGKTTLAVGTFRIAAGGQADAAGTALSAITNDLIVKLTNTNRFQVLDRQEVDQLLDEKEFRAASSNGDFKAALRRLVGADYLLYGEISSFRVDTKRITAPYLNEARVRRTSVGEGTVRLVDVATGAVSAAENVRVEEIVDDAVEGSARPGTLTERFTSEIVSRLINRTFLVTVIGVQPDGTVYLNRGVDGNVQLGAVLDVMRPGKDMRDPATGLSFGAGETAVGSVEVVAVEASRSRARVVDGRSPTIGDILRSPPPPSSSSQPKILKPAF